MYFDISIDDIYIGKIMKYDQCSIDYKGKNRKFTFERNALLIKLDWQNASNVNFYIELDKFDIEKIKNMISISENKMIQVSIDRRGKLIMTDMPFDEIGTIFVDRYSVEKFEYNKENSINNNQKQKVKEFLKQVNNKGE